VGKEVTEHEHEHEHEHMIAGLQHAVYMGKTYTLILRRCSRCINIELQSIQGRWTLEQITGMKK
jgi:hypothetical protein